MMTQQFVLGVTEPAEVKHRGLLVETDEPEACRHRERRALNQHVISFDPVMELVDNEKQKNTEQHPVEHRKTFDLMHRPTRRRKRAPDKGSNYSRRR